MAVFGVCRDRRESPLSLRRVVLHIWAGILFLTPYERLSVLPPVMFEPAGVIAALGGGLSAPLGLVHHDVLLLLRVVGLLGLCAAAFVRGCGVSASCHAVAFGSVLVLDSVAKSLNGYINHAQAVPLIVFGLVTAGQIFRVVDELGRRRGAPLPNQARRLGATEEFVTWASSVVIVVAYTFTGVNRLVYGGAAVFLSDAILSQMILASHQYSQFGFSVTPDIVGTASGPLLLRVGFACVTLLEALAVGVFYRDWFRRIWLIGISGFHLASLVLMNIFFWENLVLLWAVFGRRELAVASGVLAEAARRILSYGTRAG